MRFERDNPDQDRSPESDGQWTKEPAKRDPRFDFAAFLGPENLEDRITEVLDGKDLLDKDAYGEFAPDYVRRRGSPGERGRHEAPGTDPEEEEEEEEFSREEPEEPVEESDFREEQPKKTVLVDEPPPRPKVVVAGPAPRVYVDPQAEYGGAQEPPEDSGGSGGQALKWMIAVLISAAVVLGVLVFVTVLLPRMEENREEGPAPTKFLDSLVGPQQTQAPAAPAVTNPPAPTDPPAPTAPPATVYAVTVTAGSGGSVSPGGRVDVQEGGSVTFAIVPDEGYELGQLLVDGANVSVQGSYTFSDVRQDHTLYAVFQPAQTPPPAEPTAEPTQEPTPEPTSEPTSEPTDEPVPEPDSGADIGAPPEAGGEGELAPPEIIE